MLPLKLCHERKKKKKKSPPKHSRYNCFAYRMYKSIPDKDKKPHKATIKQYIVLSNLVDTLTTTCEKVVLLTTTKPNKSPPLKYAITYTRKKLCPGNKVNQLNSSISLPNHLFQLQRGCASHESIISASTILPEELKALRFDIASSYSHQVSSLGGILLLLSAGQLAKYFDTGQKYQVVLHSSGIKMKIHMGIHA